MDINRPDVLADVTAAFERYERALVGNDITLLDELFSAREHTVRYGTGENLYGIEAIRAFRAALPIGVQLIAAPWREDLALRAARRLEAAGVAVAPVAAL